MTDVTTAKASISFEFLVVLKDTLFSTYQRVSQVDSRSFTNILEKITL